MIFTPARIVIVLILGWTGVANAAVPLSGVVDELRQRLQISDETQTLRAAGIALQQPVALVQFYDQRAYEPAWLDTDGLLPPADALLKTVANAGREGLRATDYHHNEISKALDAIRVEPVASIQQWADLDLLLTDTWLTYASHLLSGRLSPQKVDPQWTIKPRSRDLAAMLKEALEKNDVTAALDALSPTNTAYVRLRTALADYRELEKKGGWTRISPGPTLAKGVRHPRVKEVRARLRVTGELVKGTTDTRGAEDLFDEGLRQAVRRFQQRHGLPDNGAVGAETLAELNVPVSQRMRQIAVNMERWRWLPDDLGQRYILVNIPDFSMSVVEGSQRVLDAKVIVGKSVLQTPVFTANMSYLVLSPRWNVPQTIAVKDKLPELRRDAYALARQNIRIYNQGKNEIDPRSVDWNTVSINNFPYRLRQDPGPRNALGKVKFMFPNPYNVYLHDTPSHDLFNRSQRTFSHGCIRISKPIELAEYLLKGDQRWTRDAILTASTSGRERIVQLPEEVPVHIVYWTAWVAEDGAVNFRNDIYERDKPLLRRLYSI